jgi:hypothetical protein
MLSKRNGIDQYILHRYNNELFNTVLEPLISPLPLFLLPGFVALSLGFSVLVCRSLLVLLSFLVRPLYCLSFDLRLLITPCFLQTLVIKFVSDLRQVGGFLRVLRFPPPIKMTATI